MKKPYRYYFKHLQNADLFGVYKVRHAPAREPTIFFLICLFMLDHTWFSTIYYITCLIGLIINLHSKTTTIALTTHE